MSDLNDVTEINEKKNFSVLSDLKNFYTENNHNT